MVFKIFKIIALCSLLAVTFASPTQRIVGGEEAEKNSFPHQVSIRVRNIHECSGSIINENYILTAAHCLASSPLKPYNPSEVTIRVGSMNQLAGGTIVRAKTIKIHESYGNFVNDIGLIETEHALDLSGEKAKAIALPTTDIEEGVKVSFAGWGAIESNGVKPYKLHDITMTTISTEQCNEEINFGYSSILCLQHGVGKGACDGDAGGGAIYNNEIVGVQSFAIGKCGSKYPDVFGRVYSYLNWIESNTN